jgi:dolichyl-phosphate-mannose--protein O-mannosyl transferase
LLAFYFLLKEYLWLSGFMIGLAVATKWSAVFFIPFLILLTINIRVLEPARWIKRIGQFVFVPFFVYLTSWSGWIFTSNGWDRKSGSNIFTSLWNYHVEIFNFHRNLTESHSYSANPWSWLIIGRPTSFFYETPTNCGASSCSQEILAIGTPILWWVGVFAIAITLGLFITNRNHTSAVILAGIASSYLPWFLIQSRTTFYFYAITILPFLILALIYTFNWALKYGNYQKQILLFVLLIGLNFIYFLPILLGIEIPYSQWIQRMWLNSWI